MHTKTKVKNLRKLIWIASTLTFVAILVAVFAAWILYNRTKVLLTDGLREQLLTISITQAANIDANDLAELHSEKDWEKPSWQRVVGGMHASKYNNKNVVFMYIFRKTAEDSSKMEFIADADSSNPYVNTDEVTYNDVDVNRDGKIEADGPDKLQWPGQPYDEAVDIPETFAAYDGPLTAAELYTDDYGTVLTGYAPIKDNQGNVVAVLATDIKADDFFIITNQTLYPFAAFILFLIFTILSLAIFLIYMWDKQAETLTELNYRKSEFISFATHQLRGPLTAVKGYVSMILEGDFGEVNDKVKDAVKVVYESTQSLVVLVGDYLNVSRIEQGKMRYEFQEFDLGDLVKSIVTELMPTITQAKLSVEFSPMSEQMMINADKGKIKEVISNLIDNSLKYTKQGGLTISLIKLGGKYRLSIKDTGIGIDPEVLPHLFEKFTRAPDASKTNIMGTGLGLYVAKSIVEEHGGLIWAESAGEGKGSTFFLELSAVRKAPKDLEDKLKEKVEKFNNELES